MILLVHYSIVPILNKSRYCKMPFKCPLGTTLYKQCLLSAQAFRADMPKSNITVEEVEKHCEDYVKMYLKFQKNLL